MEEILDESEANWLGSLGEEFNMQDLVFYTEEAPLKAPQMTATEPESEPEVHSEELVNMLLSKVYSGPTIGDVESALSLTGKLGSSHCSSRPESGVLEKGLSSTKMDRKYTFRIKTCVNGVADDGYKWRKYGQKSIKNSPNPRSYYRCTNRRCSAKKQVEKSTEDPETAIVTYEGLHLHYTYSHFLLSHKQDSCAASFNVVNKPKTIAQNLQKRKQPQQQKHVRAGERHQEFLLEEKSMQHGLLTDVQRPQGLLEDVVPLMVRKPCSLTTSSNEPSFSSQESSPSSLFFPPNSSQIDIGMLSSIL